MQNQRSGLFCTLNLWREALFVSLLAFSYSGLVYWFYFVGLLLLFAVTEDFHRRATSPDPDFESSFYERTGEKLQRCIYLSTVIGIFVATAIHLNAVYLKSDGETSLSWLANDFVTILNPDAKRWALLEQSSVSSLTKFHTAATASSPVRRLHDQGSLRSAGLSHAKPAIWTVLCSDQHRTRANQK